MEQKGRLAAVVGPCEGALTSASFPEGAFREGPCEERMMPGEERKEEHVPDQPPGLSIYLYGLSHRVKYRVHNILVSGMIDPRRKETPRNMPIREQVVKINHPELKVDRHICCIAVEGQSDEGCIDLCVDHFPPFDYFLFFLHLILL